MHDPEIDFLYDQLKKLSILEEDHMGLNKKSDKHIENIFDLRKNNFDSNNLINLLDAAPRNADQTLGEYLRSQNSNMNNIRTKYEVEDINPISKLFMEPIKKDNSDEDPVVQMVSRQLDKVGFGKKRQKSISKVHYEDKIEDFSDEKVYNLANKKKRKRIAFLEPRRKPYANTTMRLTNDMRFSPLDLPKYFSS